MHYIDRQSHTDRHSVWVAFDNYKRKAFLKSESKRLLLRALKISKHVNYAARYKASFHLTNLPKISSTNFASKRCIISGRVWAVNKKTNYNRFIFRTEVAQSNLPGCRRASW